MADHSNDRNGPADAPRSRADRRAESDATTIDVFSIPAPGAFASFVEAAEQEVRDSPPDAEQAPRRKRTPRSDWRLGGRTTRPWRESILAVALIALALALVAATLIEWLWISPFTGIAATGILWLAFAGVVVYALIRARPVGLFRFRALDLLYGLGFALVLRTAQGWLEAAERGTATFPSIGLVGSSPGLDWWIVDAAGGLVVAPVVEELFFRGVVLVAVFSILRRPFGAAIAGTVAILASTGLFVVLHAFGPGADVSGTLTLLLLGLVCGSLVMLTGRIWGAILVHVGFNATYLALAGVGTLLG